MFNIFSQRSKAVFVTALVVFLGIGLSACDSKPPEPMKAVKQFDSEARKNEHVAYMRKNHMDTLKHKRDETMYLGIRTEEHSLKACINCHVPEQYNGKVLRHSDPKHFCATCHIYVAAQPDCFECHADHPMSKNEGEGTASLIKGHLLQAELTQVDQLTLTTGDDVKGDAASE